MPALGLWAQTPCHMPVPWQIAGISRPLPVCRVLGEEQRITGCRFMRSVVFLVVLSVASIYSLLFLAWLIRDCLHG